MKEQTGDSTKVLLDPGCQVYDDRYFCTENQNDDVSTYRIKDESCRKSCRICFSWLNFGLLCLLIGALGGYLLRAYLDQKFEETIFGKRKPSEDVIDENVLPLTPEAMKLQGNAHQANMDQSADELDDNRHPVNEVAQSKEELLLDKAVREILENMTGVRGLHDVHLKNRFNLTKDPSQRVYLSVGMRNDYTLQACGETKLKQSFPDVDYALFGYNILKGFPLAVGHDPGFTLPIFRADYSTGAQSADCRYSVPRGLTIVPDVSCVTSFTSEIIQTESKLQESLNVAAGVSGGGFGLSFSVSGGYKKAREDISKNGKTYIVSTAKCNYYFSKLVKTNAPPFSADFLDWITRLEIADDGSTFIDFFEMFGTHFQTEVSFGARYSYEYIMAKDEYENKKKEGMNIAMAASYSGLFSVGGRFGLDSSKEEMAKKFSEKVQTKTVTVGAAPPSDGDAMKWAATVQSNPVPVYYRLSSIENLFTKDYMDGLNVNYTRVYDKIMKYKPDYITYVTHKHHLLDNCNNTSRREQIIIENTRLLIHDPHIIRTTNCIEQCHNDTTCKAVSIRVNNMQCWFYRNGHQLSGEYKAGWSTHLLRKDMREKIKLGNTAIHGTKLEESQTDSIHGCVKKCIKDYRCFAISHGNSKICKLFAQDGIKNFYSEQNTTIYFVAKCAHKDLVIRRT